MENMDILRYPIGKFTCPEKITPLDIRQWIGELETLPTRLRQTVMDLTDAQLDTPYRKDGWTVRQVVHHIADSHHHSYTRFKWALTEEDTLIKAYEEKEWSTLFDAREAPVVLSLHYLQALHAKLVYLLKGLSEAQLQRYYIHPANNEQVSVAGNMGKYAWHGNHHLAQIQNLVKEKGW